MDNHATAEILSANGSQEYYSIYGSYELWTLAHLLLFLINIECLWFLRIIDSFSLWVSRQMSKVPGNYGQPSHD